MKKLISSIFGFIVSISLVVLAAVFVAAGNRTGEENFANATRTQSITINFYNEYKNKPDQLELLTTKTYEPEEEITYPETAALPHKNSRTQNENYEWKFVGWQRMNGFELEDVELNELEEDTDVYAKYEQEMIGFTINFFNEQVTYGETALASFKYKFDSTEREYTGPEPTKESTLAYRYTFDHWETRDHKTINSLDDITKENISTYTNDDRINLFATYTQTAIEYAIQYNLGEEGTLTDEKTSYTYEDEPFDLPTPTTKTEEVTFVGWTGTDITSPSPQKEVRIDPKQYGALKNREYTAIYSTQKYKITFVIYEADTKNPGSVDHPTIDVTYGTAIPDNLTTATISFGDITVTATPSTENVRYSFEFECFETSETQVTHDMEILVRFKSTPKVYKINYENDGGETLYPYADQYTIEDQVVYLRETHKAGYTYLGWVEMDESYESVIGDENPITTFTVSIDEDLRERYYKAQYQENLYSITFTVENSEYGSISSGDQNNSNQIVISNIKEGTTIRRVSNTFYIGEATITATPAASNFEYNYSFFGWVYSNDVAVYRDIEVGVRFSRTEKQYFISYQSGPIMVTDQYGAEIASNEMIHPNQTIKIIYQLPEHHHLVHFMLNFQDISSLVVENSNEIELSFTEQYATSGNIVQIDYAEAVDTFTITFESSNTEMGRVSTEQIEDVEYGTEIELLPNNTLRIDGNEVTTEVKTAPEDYMTYVFARWDTGGKYSIDGEMTITAVFEIEYKKYQITFDSTHVHVQRKLESELINVTSGEEIEWGSEIILTYSPAQHYHCSKFMINDSDYLSELNANGQVEFTTGLETMVETEEEINKYQVTFGANISVQKDGEPVSSGEEIDALTELTVTYTLSKHYKISVFTIAGTDYSNSSNPVTFTIVEDTEIVFEEVKDKIAITAAPTTNGSFSLSASSIEEGEDVTITVTPAQYFKFARAYYIISGQEEEVDIEDLTFQMPNDPVTVYVVFEREFYYIEDAEHGVAIIVKVADVAAEPELVFEEVSAEAEEFVNSRISYKHIKFFNFKLKVGDEVVSGVDMTVYLTVPADFENGENNLFTVSLVDENWQLEDVQFNTVEGKVSFTTDNINTLVLVERADESKPSTSNKPDKNNEKDNKTLIIVVSVVSGVIVVTGIGVVIFIVKKRKIHKKSGKK